MRQEETDTRVRWRDSIVIVAVIAALIAAFVAQASHAAEASAPAFKDILQDAAQRYEDQDYLGAHRRYEQATKLDPGSLPAWRGLGWAHWRLGEEDRAFEIWNDILKIEPEDPDTLLSLGQVYESHQDWERALDYYGAVIRRAPHKAAAYAGRARVRQRTGRYEEAAADLHHALDIAPNDFDAQYLLALNDRETGRLGESRAILDRLARQDAGPRSWRRMGDVLLELDRADEALAYYRKNLALHPDDRATVQGIARAQARLQHYPGAVATLEKYVAAHPGDSNLRDELVRVAAAGGDYERAVRHLRVLSRQQPAEMRWRLKLARNLRDAGHAAEADGVVAQVLEVEPQNTGALEFQLQRAMLHGTREDAVRSLAALTEADPTGKRLVRLGGAWVRLGDEYTDGRETARAQEAYRNAARAFQRAAALDPQDADAVLGAASALRLSGHASEAANLAQRIAARYPGSERAWRELYEARMALGDFAAAEQILVKWQAQNPRNIRLRQDLDRTRFQRGERDAAIRDLQALLREPVGRGVPVLLYHGLTETAPAEDTMPLANFKAQMRALHAEGYHAIRLPQLLAWQARGAALPDKPVLITFDDARADSFRYADPVLKQYGYSAVMFTPTAEVGRHGDYNAPWSVIRALHATGRWDIQCHSHAGHAPIVVDASGRRGAFLANRMWLKGEKRLETHDEFVARLEADYRECAQTLRRELPGAHVAGYAYPFGEYGQRALSNERDAAKVNAALVKRYYHAGFVQDTGFEVTRLSDPVTLERFEVPWDASGADLVSSLRKINARTSTELLIADLYSWDGRYAAATRMLDEAASSGRSDRADVLARRGRVTLWQGDFAAARMYLADAVDYRATDPIARQSLADLDRRVRPQFSLEGDTESDNHQRDSLSLGPDQKTYLSDRAVMSVGYRYREFTDARLQAAGNELQADLTYRMNWRTSLSASAGVAQFEDRSTVASAPKRQYVPYAVGVDVPFGESVDYSLRAQHRYVDAAGAVLAGLAAAGLQQQLTIRPRRDTTLAFTAAETRYDDGNRRSTVEAKGLQRVVAAPDVQVGYRFRYDDARDANPYFYTPDRYVGNDAIAQLETQWRDTLHFAAEAALGAGQEHGGGPQFEGSLYGTARYDFGERFNFWLTGGRNQAAAYRSVQVLGGLSLLF